MIPTDELDGFPAQQLARGPSYGPAWDAAIAAGIDVALLEDNLRLTPAQRVEQHQRMTELWWSLRATSAGVGREGLG